MCGIIGYIGNEQALPILIEGLRRESYRGYDSSGVVVFDTSNIHFTKAVGKLEILEEKIKNQDFTGSIGLGHNRWATHGTVTEANAHPHVDCRQNIFVTHNGIIENYHILKEALQKRDHTFTSQTDTEVLSHLIEHFFKGNLEQATSKALRCVKGAYAIAVISKDDPDKIVAARFSAPLVISTNRVGGFVASDPAAILGYSHSMIFLDDGQLAVLKKDSLVITDLQGNIQEQPVTEIEWNLEEAKKEGYAHFMLKEIISHPESLENVLRGRLLVGEGAVKLGGLEDIKDQLRDIKKIQIVACGGSSYAAGVGEYILEEYGGIPTKVDVGSEFRYKKILFDKETLYVFISQSGETADTLAALREVKKYGGLTLGIVNVVGSTLAREVGAGIYTHSGPEIAVASTKTFTGQLGALYLLALFFANQRGAVQSENQNFAKELLAIPSLARKILEKKSAIEAVAKKYKDAADFWVIGRKYSYPIALEAALKLKEVAYIHGEGIEGGELKHGSLSLIRENFPTIAIVPSDSVYEKMVSNIQEIKARSGPVIAIATEGNTQIEKIADDVIYIPPCQEIFTPLLSVIALHLFAYYIALARGCEIDQPRNLAKSVTVE